MQLNYKEFGSGFPVIILHGLFGMLDNWQSFAKKLAEDYSVYILDLRNHGKSPWDDNITYSLMAEDLLFFMQDKWIYNAHIIGHSMGAKVAMKFALQFPDYCESLISVDMGVEQHFARHYYIFDALKELDLTSYKKRSAIVDTLSDKIKSRKVIQFLMKNIKWNKDIAQFEMKMNLDAIINNYQNILKPISEESNFTNPALFVKGTESDYVRTEEYPEIRKHFPEVQFKEIEGAGHWVHADKPIELEMMIREFLQE